MQAVYNKKDEMIGDIDPCDGGGWFATHCKEINGEYIQYGEAFFRTKRAAIQWLKREDKLKTNTTNG